MLSKFNQRWTRQVGWSVDTCSVHITRGAVFGTQNRRAKKFKQL